MGRCTIFVVAGIAAVLGGAGCGDEYDIVIRGGTVIDGTGAPSRQADVAIRGDRIVEIGNVMGSGSSEIDATGLMVTPGFIDMHSHSDGGRMDPFHYSEGIEHVFVNGIAVVQDGSVTGALPGRALRGGGYVGT